MTTNYVTFILDETGSMMSIKDDTIGGFNHFLAELNKVSTPDQPTLFTLVKFDSNKQEVVHRAAPLNMVPELNGDSYRPGASTPLIDACVKAIKATEAAIGQMEGEVRVQVVIQTDGQENASTEFTNEDLNRLIKEKTAAGWLFQFLGAGQDAFNQAGKMGIAPGRALQYDRGESKAAFAASARMSSEHAAIGSSEEFTQAERTSAAGQGGQSSADASKATERSLVEDMDFFTP